MGDDDHVIIEGSMTGCNGMRFSVDLNQAHATTADGLQAIVVTKSRNVDADTTAGFENRRMSFKLSERIVNFNFNQLRILVH